MNEDGKSVRRMTIRKALFYAAVVAALFLSAAALVTWRYSDSIKQLVIGEINSRLNAEVTVGDMQFSILRHFPYASVSCDQLLVRSADFPDTDTLLAANRLSLLFKLTGLWSGHIHLERARIRDGALHLKIDSSGKANYRISKNDSAASSDTLDLHLGNVGLENLAVTYQDERTSQHHLFVIREGSLDALFEGTAVHIGAALDVDVGQVRTGGLTWLATREARIEGAMTVHDDTITFDDARIRLDHLALSLHGDVYSPAGYADYRLRMDAGHSDLRTLIGLLPGGGRWKDFRIDGKARLTVAIAGRADEKQQPVITAEFGTENASIRPAGSDISLSQVDLAGRYTSQKSKSAPVSYLKIDRLHGRLQGRELNGLLEVEDFADPLLHVEANASADLKMLSRFFKPDTVDFIEGDLELTRAVFAGRLSKPASYMSSGSVAWKNGVLKIKSKPGVVKDIEGRLTLQRNNLRAEALSGRIGSTDFAFAGEPKNFFGYLLEPEQQLEMKLSLKSSMLNLNEVLERDDPETTADTVYRIRFARNIAFSMDASIDHFRFNQFKADNLKGTVGLRNKVLYTERLQFDAMEGNVSLDGSIVATETDSLVIQYHASVMNLDINRLFEEMGNFGQTVITDKNLGGRVTATLYLDSRWSNSLACNTDRIVARADVAIDNGRLVGYSPMQALSRYVKGADLNDIRFSELRNEIRIENRRVIIPQMEINSSALNIILSGTHSFDNTVDYHLQLLLSQLLGRKVKNLNTEFGTIEEDNLGKTRLFITMKGSASDPKFSYDARGVHDKIAADIKKEKETLKQILKEEFGKKQSDVSSGKKKQEEIQIEQEEDEGE